MMKKSLLDIVKEERNRAVGAGAYRRFLRLREPGSVLIRFLDDLSGDNDMVAMRYYVNTKRNPFGTFLCQDQDGGRNCEYCKAGLPRSMVVAFRVFDYSEKVVKIFELKAGSPLMGDLINYYEEFGTLTDRDYILKRSGIGLNTAYTLIPKERKPFGFKKTARETWIGKEEVEDLVQKVKGQ